MPNMMIHQLTARGETCHNRQIVRALVVFS